jgi:hypothetical protein
LDLLFDPVDSALNIDDTMGNRRIQSLTADGIGFPQHFLRDKIQPPAYRFALSAA